MIIQHNMNVLNTNRILGITNNNVSEVMKTLSSGYRVNKAADDAAGLSISEKMRRQIHGMNQAVSNAEDGVSLIQTADGTLNEIHSMLQRGGELAVKAANDTLMDEDRAMIDDEIKQLKKEIDDITEKATFNTKKLFPADGKKADSVQVVETNYYDVKVNINDGSVAIQKDNGAGGTGGTSGTTPGKVLADKIAEELIPNAVKQIMDTFPTLKNFAGSDSIDMSLEISSIDGENGTLAYAQVSYTSSGATSNFVIRVDSADFSDEDAQGGARSEMLESTIAHELMHSVMYYTMIDEMVGLGGTEEFPQWFVEGTAQLSGGGYTTGWNDIPQYYARQLSDADDNSLDGNIKSYLNNYTVDGRPYGHGYFAAAYIGYLANVKAGGSTDVTAANIAAGIDSVFNRIINQNMSFSDAVSDATGKSVSEIKSLINAKGTDNSGVEFVRRLSYNSKDGAGSVITGGLNTGGTRILDEGTVSGSLLFGVGDRISIDMRGSGTFYLQVGANAGEDMTIEFYQMNCNALGLENTNTLTREDSENAITGFQDAIKKVSRVRSYYGAIQNRLSYTINNLENSVENTTSAESQIRDTNMAEAMTRYTTLNILMQSGQAMLVQANQKTSDVLSLLS